ncbi:hypothetical protein, partial [Membranihabitans maritimus]|uniref:hypothetical protein n=1 Tax=Membranihabitans maritimus TaxID=2904244 RepID=UPI001F44AD0F
SGPGPDNPFLLMPKASGKVIPMGLCRHQCQNPGFTLIPPWVGAPRINYISLFANFMSGQALQSSFFAVELTL